MTGFDDAPSVAVAVVQAAVGFDALAHAVLVRDLQGRVRLVFDVTPGGRGPDLAALEAELTRRLGAWFMGPVLATDARSPQEARAARVVLDMAGPWPAGRGVQHPDTGVVAPVSGSWRLLSRRLTKHAWLERAPARLPWPLVRGAPALVAFHSFKGGVGRTTLLGFVALELARRGKRVVCVDLDLESPGLDTVLGVTPGPGALDLLLEHTVTGEVDVEPLLLPVAVHGVEIELLPAGILDEGFAEKLARLDYTVASAAVEHPQSPVARALQAVLAAVRRARKPDYILLDLRSGLSDLAGISLVATAHVDVVVARSSGQGELGLRAVLPRLRDRRAPDDQRFIVVHAMATLPYGGDAMRAEAERLRQEAWRLLYENEPDPPPLDDPTGPHHPWSIGRYDEIASMETLERVSLSALRNDGLLELVGRVEELCAPEDADV